jgi:hypothetical protein
MYLKREHWRLRIWRLGDAYSVETKAVVPSIHWEKRSLGCGVDSWVSFCPCYVLCH